VAGRNNTRRLMDSVFQINQPESPLVKLASADFTPIFWPPPTCDRASAWLGHLPFVNWLVWVVRPRLYFELGSRDAVSYGVICQALKRIGLDARCVAVDCGDHKNNAERFIEDSIEDARYGHSGWSTSLSNLVRGRFSEACSGISDDSVDLLHINGLYLNSFEELDLGIFKSKLSDRAIVLLYGTNDGESNPDVCRLWRELAGLYPSFEFPHSNGMGVLCIGEAVLPQVLELCSLSMDDISTLRARFGALGRRWELEASQRQLNLDLAERESRMAALERMQGIEADAGAAEAAEDAHRMAAMVRAAHEARVKAEECARQALLQRDQMLSSITWRAARPIHRLVGYVPRPIIVRLRSCLNAVNSLVEFGSRRRQASKANLHPEAPQGPVPPGRANGLDLYDDRDVQAAAGLAREQILWSPQRAQHIHTYWSAARFCIDLLRNRSDLRERFPRALSAGESGEFAKWITSTGGDEFGLSERARSHLKALFKKGIASRVRQSFLCRHDLKAAHPLGLTPIGRRDLFRWFAFPGRMEENLRLEEIWWFFLECAEDPAGELVRTYLFMPAWQKLYPDGITVFGRRALAKWLSATFHLTESWIDPDKWPESITPAEQIRLAYHSRPEWQSKHPLAFTTKDHARALLAWLSGPDSGLPKEVRDWCSELNFETTVADLVACGVNILGHFCYPSGLRTSVESISAGLGQAGVKVSLRDIRTDPSDDPHHINYTGMEFYDTTILHLQPDPFFNVAFDRADLLERTPRTYRIAYWYYELDMVPESWREQCKLVDEVWAATNFVADAIKKRTNGIVNTMLPGVQLGEVKVRPRGYFGLGHEEQFVFLFVFSMLSAMERKNPIGLIRALKRGFSVDEPVTLVLKTSFGERFPGQMKELYAAAAGANVIIIDEIFSQEETLSLIETCDAYVSLHRSEGLGLTMAEAMFLGKPVIATGYSGNVDFMDAENSLLVDYRLVQLGRTVPPYDGQAHWAEPSVDHAARLMRQIYENRSWAAELGAKAKIDLTARMSVKAAGKRMAERLAQIAVERSRPLG
jgi:glycosyltransferase involved in cell wall biosynthesis